MLSPLRIHYLIVNLLSSFKMVAKKLILCMFYVTIFCSKRLDRGTSSKEMDEIPK